MYDWNAWTTSRKRRLVRYTALRADTQETMNTFFTLLVAAVVSLIPKSFATIPQPAPIDLLATGDVLTARSVNARMVRDNNFQWPYEHIADHLRGADITLINLETPLVEPCPVRHDGMVFCGDVRNAQALADAGVDVVGIANNHAGNQGQAGVDQTVRALEAAGLTVIGVEQPKILEKNGRRVAFLAYNDVDRQVGIAHTDPERMTPEIAEARQQANVVIVSVHWGNEYTHTPTRRQRELAAWLAEQGVDIVVGNHAHWVQPTEWVGDTLVTFANGNTVFDQMWSEETRLGQLTRYTLDGDRTSYTHVPLTIYDYGQPHPQTGSTPAQ